MGARTHSLTTGPTRDDMTPGGDRPRNLRLAPYLMLALAGLGIADAFYVAHGAYTGQLLWCPIIDGCNTVAQSPYARLFGVPLSYLGLAFYVCMLGPATLLALHPRSRATRVVAVLSAATGVSYSIYGMYLQLSVIQAICIYCLVSAVITVLLLVTALRHVRAARTPAIRATAATPLPAGG